MTEKPGRRALFTGAMVPKKHAAKEETMAETEKIGELAEAVRSALMTSLAGKQARIDPARFESEYSSLVDVVNVAADKVIQLHTMRSAGTTPVTAGEGQAVDTKSIIMENPLPMLVLDTEGIILDPNNAFLTLSGYSASEITGKSFQSFNLIKKRGDSFSEAIRNQKRAFAEVEISFPSGNRILESHAIPLFRADGILYGVLIIYIDLTDKKTKEIELSANLVKNEELRQRAEVIVRENPMPIILVDARFSILVVNDAYVTMTGIDHTKLLSMTLRDCRVLEQKGEGLREVIGKKQRSFGEVKVDLPTGEHWLQQWGIPILGPEGDVSQILIVYNDITEEKKRNEENVVLQRRAFKIIEDNPLAIGVFDKKKRLIDVNHKYEELWKASRSELLGKSKINVEITLQKGDEYFTAFSEKRKSTSEMRVRWPDGSEKILLLHAIPIFDDTREIDEVFYVYIDVTAERREMEEIAALHKQADAIVQENPYAIILADTSFRVTDTNEAFLKMSGFSRDQFIGMSLKDIKILAKSGDGARDALQKKTRVFGEVQVELPSGIHLLEQYVIPLLDSAGDITSTLIVYNEITEQRAQQEEIKKKMEEIASLKKRSDVIVMENPLPIMVMDLSFNITLVNESYCRLSGISRENLMKMNAKSFRVLDQKGEGLKVVLQQKKRSFGEVTVEFPGSTKILEQYGLPLLDETGKITHILTVYNDVTNNREQEKKIAEMIEESRAGKEVLTASASELETAMAHIAQGDLTKKVSIDEADPLVKLKTDYNTAIDSIRDALEELERSMLQLDKTINDLNRSTAEILRATEQVAVASQKSSDNTSANLTAIEKLNSDISEISASIEEIASTSQDVMQHAGKASEEGHVAVNFGKVATSKMQMVEKISSESVNDITKLNEQMREINKIVKLIADIANQTNLLALNAAIEAARAGEHGRGFAVVAGEVKSLAGESKNASNQIENLIKTIQKNSEMTASSMKHSFDEVKAGIETVNQTIDSLNKIVSESEVVSQGITQITKATMDQADSTNRVMSETEDSRRFTKENLERLQDMAAMAEETSASTEEIARGSASLAEMSDRLKKIMDQFTLR